LDCVNRREKDLDKVSKFPDVDGALVSAARVVDPSRAVVSVANLTPGARVLQRQTPALSELVAVETRAILERAGLSPSALEQPDGWLPVQTLVDLMEMAARVTGDAAFGLHCGMYSERGDLELLEYLISSCATLGDTFEVAVRYQPLSNDVVHHDLVREGENIVWQIRLPPGLDALEDFLLAWVSQLTRRASGFPVSPLQVRFVHSRPSFADEYERHFHAPIVYGAECAGLVMNGMAMHLPFVTADPALHRLLRTHADALLAARPAHDSVLQQVRTLVAAELPHGGATLERIAKKAHMSVSTLRRRLRSEGILFGALVEEVQMSIVRRSVADPQLAIKDLATRAGFASVPTFYRAFGRWFGETPARYRKLYIRHPASAWLGPTDGE
jgi:AraC-like DNA-binding protein